MEITSVQSEDERVAFLSVATKVYGKGATWLSASETIVRQCLCGESLYSGRSKTRSFLALEGGAPVARAMAQIDTLHRDYWVAREGVNVGHVLFFEALPAQRAAATRVLGAASEWLQEEGCGVARMGYLHGRQMPLAIDAYSERPLLFHSNNPPYYHAFIKEAGFRTEAAFSELCMDLDEARCQSYTQFIAESASRGVSLVAFDREESAAGVVNLVRLYNDAFAGTWGWTPLADLEEVTRLLTGEILVDDFLYFAHVREEVVGFMLGLPDLYQGLGSARERDDVDHGLLLWAGVHDNFRRLGVARALASKICLSMRARGYQRVSPTIVADENVSSRRLFATMGAYVRRNFVTYIRSL